MYRKVCNTRHNKLEIREKLDISLSKTRKEASENLKI